LNRERSVHLALACFVVVLWGVSFAVTRVAVREIPPMTLALFRFVLASLTLWPFVRARCGSVSLARADRWPALGLGVVGVTLYFAFENCGLKHTTASHGALIVSTIPLLTVLVESVRDRTLPSARVVLGLAAGLAGVALIVGRPEGEASRFGDALMFGASFCWVGYTFLVKRLADRYPSLWITQAAMVAGAATLLPLALIEWLRTPLAPPSGAAWFGVVFLGVLCSAVAYLLWNAALRVIGASSVNILIYGIPLVGVLTGVAALGEPFTARILGGGFLIVGGVTLATIRTGALPGRVPAARSARPPG